MMMMTGDDDDAKDDTDDEDEHLLPPRQAVGILKRLAFGARWFGEVRRIETSPPYL